MIAIDEPMPRPATLNMAIDETLLQTLPQSTLRFYRWIEPSVSFGYFGKVDEAEEFAKGRALVRRWTGGGIVPHGEDVTYSILISAADATFRWPPRTIYQAIHSAIAQALEAVGVHATLSNGATLKISDACFANPVLADLIEGSRKIAGAAQRKTRNGLLHQGSIQRPGLGKEFRQRMAEALSENILRGQLPPAVLARATTLAAQKYATSAWLRRR